MNSKVGQLFFIGVADKTLSSGEEKYIIENNVGGVALFERNIESPKQLYELCSHIQSLSQKQEDKAPIFIATDMEGGSLATLKAPYTQWPSLKKLADKDSTSLAFQMAQQMGAELFATGFNVNFAPCIDTLTNSQNELIGDRSLSSDPEIVSKMSSALVRGYIKSNILPCAKHFPGHGNTVIDSHEDLPVDDISEKDLEEKLMSPFKKAFRARLDLVMTAHIQFSQVDNQWPATLSEKFIKEILRKDLRYRNLVLADDLEMAALSKNFDPKLVTIQAIRAGIDLLMYCHNVGSHVQPIETIKEALGNKEIDALQINESYNLVMDIKKKKLGELEYPSLQEAESIIGCEEHQKTVEEINS